MTIKITKQLATMEDLAIGTGTVVQERNGVPLTLTKIDFNSRVIRVTSVVAMKALEVEEGTSIQTLGYYAARDGGGAFYSIVSPQAHDGMGDVEMNNGNVAVLLHPYREYATCWGVVGAGDHSPALQNMIFNQSIIRFPAAITINSLVYLKSDRSYIGLAANYGGTVARSSTGEPMFKGGTEGNATHTRISWKGIKCINVNNGGLNKEHNYMLDMRNGYMNDLDNNSFGDVVITDNPQCNAFAVSGSAHSLGTMRCIGMRPVSGNEENTGIGVLLSGASNQFDFLQCETGAIIKLVNTNNNFIATLHLERSGLHFVNSSFNKIASAYIIDCVYGNFLDEKSNYNELNSISGVNSSWNDAGLFNRYTRSALNSSDHALLDYGVKETYLPYTPVASAWNDSESKAYIPLASRGHMLAVCVKNTSGDTSVSGTIEIYDATADSVLASKAYGPLLTRAQGVPQNNSSLVETQTLAFVLDLTQGNKIIIRGTGDLHSTGFSHFVSPAENVNPTGASGSGWGVAGAPSAGESNYVQRTNIIPTLNGAGKVQFPLTTSTFFSINQFFVPKTPAKKFLMVFTGTWADTTILRLTSLASAHNGSRGSNVANSGHVALADGKKMLMQFVSAENLSSPSRTSISVGAYDTGVKADDTVVMDYFICVPIE